MKTTRFIDAQIIAFLKQAKAGMSIKELCRSGGFSQPTFTSDNPWISSVVGGLLSLFLDIIKNFKFINRTDME